MFVRNSFQASKRMSKTLNDEKSFFFPKKILKENAYCSYNSRIKCLLEAETYIDLSKKKMFSFRKKTTLENLNSIN